MVEELEDIRARNLRHSRIVYAISGHLVFTGPLLCLTEWGQHQWKSEGNGPKLQYAFHRFFSFRFLIEFDMSNDDALRG
jgi:hypothetical protein